MRAATLLLACLFFGACSEPAQMSADAPALSELLGAGADPGFPRATEVREFSFPADHGAHPGYRNEWWYVTGNLDSDTGRRFGFELTLFRFSLTPATPEPVASRWATNQVYIGHFALTDVDAQQFHVAERFARGAAGLAGASGPPVRVWLYDWSIRQRGVNGWQLSARDGDVRLELSLEAIKPVVLQGNDGLSQKSSEPGNASYYYSLPRLRSQGELETGGDTYTVSGLSWLDREWGSSALAADQQGWDWFALQLDDGHDLMFYNLRRRDGVQGRYSAGSLVAPDGSVTRLSHDDAVLTVLDTWESPRGGTYPAAWRLELPAHNIVLRIEPVMAEQELTTWVRYWEGAVDVRGAHGARAVAGRGYVELTGYASRVAGSGDMR